MGYSPENNPYIPGDPYSYDLKWMVQKINEWKDPLDSAEKAAQSAEEAAQQVILAADQVVLAENAAGEAASSAQTAKDYADNIADPVSGIVTDWLDDHITQPTTPAIDTSLTVAGAAADAKVTGDYIRSRIAVENSLIEDISSDKYIWQIGRTINGSGTEISGAGMALTYMINIQPGSCIINRTNNIGDGGVTTAFFVHEYVSGVWQRRTLLDSAQPQGFTPNSQTDGIRIAYGYSTGMGVTMTQQLLEDYFKMSIVRPAVTVDTLAPVLTSVTMRTGSNISSCIDLPGSILWTSGKDDDTITTYSKSGFIPVGANTRILYRDLYETTQCVALAVYNAGGTYDAANSVRGQGSTSALSGIFTMPYDGFIRFGTRNGALGDAQIYDVTSKKSLNILVLGNSFSQDAFAYLPVVLDEMMPDHLISYGVAYTSGASIADHVTYYQDSTAYTWFDFWNAAKQRWDRYTGGNAVTLVDIMDAMPWDIIYIQPVSAVTADPAQQALNAKNNIIDPGRDLIRILQDLDKAPFRVIMGQWLATSHNGDNGEYIEPLIVDILDRAISQLGYADNIPIGAAFQDARTNSTLQALGDAGNMLYDTHMQSGIPALLAAYTIAIKIADMIGAPAAVYGCTFEPTTANCIAINAYSSTGMVTPYPMTHGDSAGVNSSNIKAVQEIAQLAVRNPEIIIDCSAVV